MPTHRRLPHPNLIFAVLLAALPLLACRGDEARVSVSYFDAPLLPRNALTVTVDDGGVRRTLRGADIGAEGRQGRELATRMRGTLRVAFQFVPGSAVASEGEVEVPLRRDWRYGFDIRVASLNPTTNCFGCIGARAFPLAAQYRQSPGDSVWVVWGGNSIKHPVVY